MIPFANLSSLILTFCAASVVFAAAPSSFVYTMTNASTGNQVLIYSRGADGSLLYQNAASTGGIGTGYQLGTQGSLISNGLYLFAVNPASNTITVLKGGEALTVVSTVSSGGAKPVSLTYFEGYLYVLNAGTPNNITGFTFDNVLGILTPIAGSTQPLTGTSVGPSQVSFNHAGTALVVTEKISNLIDVFPVTAGLAGPLTSYPAHGKTPDGFAFGRNSLFYVAEAWSGTGRRSASVSSYSLGTNSIPALVSGSVPSGQPGTCCLTVTPNGSYVFASDSGTPFFTSYVADSRGKLTQSNYIYTTSAAKLADITVSDDGLNLYILDHQKGNVFAFAIGPMGQLTPVSGGSFAPDSASGLLVR